MIVHAVEAAMASDAHTVTVVTGHEHASLETALSHYEVQIVHNPDFSDGLSTSLAQGLRAVDAETEGVIVCLGDMPALSARHINRMIAGFDPVEGRAICVPTHRGKRGNPVLFARQFFSEIEQIRGDAGAKYLLGEYEEVVCEIEMTDEAVLLDIDSPEQLTQFTARSTAHA